MAIRLDGTKVTPLLITKGKKETIKHFPGVYILESEKAWCTQSVIRKWIDLVMPPILRGTQRGLLIWDSASTHRAKEMKSFLSEKRIDQVMIPAGMTSYLQSLDLVINKPFKDFLRMEVSEYIENRMERNQRGNFVKPKNPEVSKWVKNSWGKITDECVLNALRAGYLDKNFPFSECSVAKHERVGRIIMEKITGNELQKELDQISIHDDIPEDDEVIIFE